MPRALQYYAPPTQERRDLSGVAENERQLLRTRYERALAYYRGNHPEQLTYEEDERNDNTTINVVKMVAERTAAFLFAQLPRISPDIDSPQETDEETWLRMFLEDNGGLTTLYNLAITGFLAGQVYVKLTPSEPYPVFTKLPVGDVITFWHAETGRAIWYEYRFVVGTSYYLVDYVREGTGWKWYKYRANGRSQNTSNLTRILDKALETTTLFSAGYQDYVLFEKGVWEDVTPPILEIAHLPDPDTYYGSPELQNTRLQDSINALASRLDRVISENADPVDVLIGADPDSIEMLQDLITVPSSEASIHRLTMETKVVELQEILDKRIDFMLAELRVVILRGGVKDLQRVTNASVRTLFLDMLTKNELLKTSYGTFLKRLGNLAMISAKVIPKAVELAVDFAFPLPLDETEKANVNALMVNMGARSLQSAAVEMGDNWELELARMGIEREQKLKEQEEDAELQKKLYPPDPQAETGGLTNEKDVL